MVPLASQSHLHGPDRATWYRCIGVMISPYFVKHHCRVSIIPLCLRFEFDYALRPTNRSEKVISDVPESSVLAKY